MLTDAQRQAIAAIKAAGHLQYWDGGYWAGQLRIRSPIARALIAGKYLEGDAVRNATEATMPVAIRVIHFRLTGKDQDESEEATNGSE